MNWEAISAIGQIVGALAVVISLIYLAREIGRNARAERLASMDSLNRWLGELVAHPHVRELYYRGIHDFESLEGVDRTRFNLRIHQIFRNVKDAYHHHLEGHLDPRVWRELEAVMREINAAPGVQAWWRSNSRWFGGEEFAKFINQQQQTATRHDD